MVFTNSMALALILQKWEGKKSDQLGELKYLTNQRPIFDKQRKNGHLATHMALVVICQKNEGRKIVWFDQLRNFNTIITTKWEGKILCDLTATRSDSSDQLHRSYRTQYCCGYFKLRYFEGTLQLLWQELTVHAVAEEYPQSILQGTPACSSHSGEGI